MSHYDEQREKKEQQVVTQPTLISAASSSMERVCADLQEIDRRYDELYSLCVD